MGWWKGSGNTGSGDGAHIVNILSATVCWSVHLKMAKCCYVYFITIKKKEMEKKRSPAK